MKPYRIIIFLAFSFNVLIGQEQAQIDSIKKLILSLNSDTALIRNYLLLGEWIADINEWPVYNQKALDLTEKNLGLSPGKKEKAELLKFKASALNNVGYYHRETNDYKKAMLNYEQSKKIYSEIGNKEGEAVCLTNIGALDVAMGNVAEGVSKYNQALKIFGELGDKKNIAPVLNNIGNQYLNQGNMKLALDYFTQALKIYIETKNISGELIVYTNFGSLYFGQKEYQTAFDFYNKAHKIYLKQNDKLTLAKSYSNLAVTIKPLDRTKSLQFDSLALKLFTELGHEEGISKCYNNLGSTLSEMNQLELGVTLVTKSYLIREKIEDLEGMCISAGNLAEMYLYVHKFDSALDWGEREYALTKRLGIKKNRRNAAQTLAKIYAKLKDFEKAYNYHMEFKALNDSILNNDSKNLAAQQLARMEFEKREVELKLEQDKKDLISNEEKHKQKLITVSVSIVLVLVLILVVIVFRSLRINQKKNKIITEQKHLVEEKQKEIIDSIHYAKRIQQSLMPTSKYIAKKIEDLKK